VFPPKELINFYANESEVTECSKVIAVENDHLQMIDVKKKEIKRLSLEGSPDKEFLVKLSVMNRCGRGFCTIIRDY
jgi:hypothetical protein